VLRRLLLAVLFCLSAWAVTDRASTGLAIQNDSVDSANSANSADSTGNAAALAADATTASIGANVATPPIDTHPPEARWESVLPPGLNSGSSKTQHAQAQAADLPGVSSRVPWPVVRRTDAEGHAARFRSAHLLHTPLLI
jgi:hypothetical protein